MMALLSSSSTSVPINLNTYTKVVLVGHKERYLNTSGVLN